MKPKRGVPVLIPFLVLVSAIFIGILIFAYVETKKANPQMIEVGEVRRLLPPQRHEGSGGNTEKSMSTCAVQPAVEGRGGFFPRRGAEDAEETRRSS